MSDHGTNTELPMPLREKTLREKLEGPAAVREILAASSRIVELLERFPYTPVQEVLAARDELRGRLARLDEIRRGDTPAQSSDLYDVVGRSGNLATAIERDGAERLAAVSGGTVRLHRAAVSEAGVSPVPVSLTADPGDECDQEYCS